MRNEFESAYYHEEDLPYNVLDEVLADFFPNAETEEDLDIELEDWTDDYWGD